MILTKNYKVKGAEDSAEDSERGQDATYIINITDLEGFTPLDVAIMNNNVRAAAELIQGGANINVSFILSYKTAKITKLNVIDCRKTPNSQSVTLTRTTGPFICPAPTDTWP